MDTSYGRTRKRGQPRQDGYDLQLMLHVDLGMAFTGKSFNAFAKTHPLRLADGTTLEKGSLRRRYYERRMLMAPIEWPDGKSEQGPMAKAYARFLDEVKAVIIAG